MIIATHVTLNESDASESITSRSIKSLNAHFSVDYLDNAHFSKIKGCLGSVSCTKQFRYQFAVHYGLIVHEGNLVNGLGRIMHSPSARALSRPRPLTRLPSCTKTHNARQSCI